MRNDDHFFVDGDRFIVISDELAAGIFPALPYWTALSIASMTILNLTL
jgi:hypothetical protein